MKVLILGATGRVGSRLLRYAHEAGHDITVYVRDPQKLPHDISVQVFEGDILDAGPLQQACTNQDIVCSALGAPTFSQDPEFLTTAIWAVSEAMEANQLKRLIWMSGEAILENESEQLRMNSPGFPPLLQGVAQDHLGVYEFLQASDFDWTLICPPPMPERVRTGHYRVRSNQHPDGGEHISVEDVADFILKEMTEAAYLGQRVGLAY